MTTINLPSTLTATIEQVDYDREAKRDVYAVVLRFGIAAVKVWTIDEAQRQAMERDGHDLEEFVADKLAALFTPVFAVGGCSCGPGA